MTEVNETELKNYLVSDRQWLRRLRIAHAKAMIDQARKASDHGRVLFYQAVLEALED